MLGRRIGRFEVERLLGRGGMGAVYAARDVVLDRSVAIKVLSRAHEGDDERRRWLIREARSAAALSHPNVATVFEAGLEGDTVYVAMELCEGETLAEAIRRGPLSLAAWIDACSRPMRRWGYVVLAFALLGCGAGPQSVPPLPECAGEGEEGAVAAALHAFLASPDGTVLGDAADLFSPALSCRVRTEDGALTLSRDGGGSSRQPFLVSCWARGGPEDGQCREFGRARRGRTHRPTAP